MTQRASGTFDITGWDEYATDARPGGITLGRVRVTKAFHGDLEGTSVTEIQTVHTESGPAAYVGIEHFEGSVHGRKGTFVLQHCAGGGADGQWLIWRIVSTSGTGELAGLSGEGQITVDEDGGHSYVLEYR
ncbi:DUF3224 domain-containing protein [Thermomonospora amylolytica]|uniref:DUF3224 domain-containing protein n=1 Tax=Thermomonospora amylolytica TaxID=1411117 RepID=UPI001300345B|nr:DUF3224 domain-containing protein [Thermomonospora amylolytica]